MEAELCAHVQHRGVLGEHLPVHAFQPDRTGVFDHALHQEPAEAVALERRAHDHGVFAAAGGPHRDAVARRRASRRSPRRSR